MKPPPPGSAGGHRHIGAQPGHERHERTPFPPAQVDRIVDHTPTRCPDCGGKLVAIPGPSSTMQQVELVEKPYEVTEHTVAHARRAHCRMVVWAQLPPAVAAAGLLGPRLTAHVVWLKTRTHLSYSNLQLYLKDAFQLQVSRGLLDKVVPKAGRGPRPEREAPHRAARYGTAPACGPDRPPAREAQAPGPGLPRAARRRLFLIWFGFGIEAGRGPWRASGRTGIRSGGSATAKPRRSVPTRSRKARAEGG